MYRPDLWLYGGVSSVLFVLTHVYAVAWWLYIPAILLLCLGVTQVRTTRGAFCFGWLVGSCKAAAAIIWIWNTYPIDWLGSLSVSMQLLIIGLYWVVTSIVIGLGVAVFAVLYHYIRVRPILYAAIPVAWIIGEVAGSFLFSLYSWGAGSVPNTHFSFGYIGYQIVDLNWVLPWAHAGGVYALSFLAWCLVGVVWLLLQQQYRNVLGLVGLIGVSTVCFSIPYTPDVTNVSSASVFVVDTQFAPHMFLDADGFATKQQEVIRASIAAIEKAPDYIVLPEDARLTDGFPSPMVALAFLQQYSTTTVVIDTARTRDQSGDTVLRAYIYDTAQSEVYTVDKQYLVPQGEFVPYLHGFVLSHLTKPAWYEGVQQSQSYRPGSRISYDEIPDTIPAVLFCMESSSGFAAKQLSNRQAMPFMAHPVSHAWFHNDFVLTFALDRMLRTQSVWANVPVVKAGNMSQGSVYDPKGVQHEGILHEQAALWRVVEYRL